MFGPSTRRLFFLRAGLVCANITRSELRDFAHTFSGCFLFSKRYDDPPPTTTVILYVFVQVCAFIVLYVSCFSYHSTENDCQRDVFVFESIKTVTSVIDTGRFFRMNLNRNGHKFPAGYFVDDYRYPGRKQIVFLLAGTISLTFFVVSRRLQQGSWPAGHVGADRARGQDRRRLA